MDVCCIVGNAALSETLANVKCVGARDYFLLSPFTVGWTVTVRALGRVRYVDGNVSECVLVMTPVLFVWTSIGR